MVETKSVILGDYHAPFHSKRGTKRALELIGDLKPKYCVQIGDLYDQLSATHHPHSRNVMTPAEECNQARAAAVALWAGVRAASPKTKCFQISGNHDARTMKRVLESLPEVEHLVRPALRELYEFEGVKTVHSEWDELFLENVCYMHGFRKQGDHAKWNNMSTVHGHDHKGALTYIPHRSMNLFELSVGFLGEVDSPAFGYRSQKAIHGWNLGIGVIDTLGPRFVSFDK